MRLPGAPHPWPKFGFSVFYNFSQKIKKDGEHSHLISEDHHCSDTNIKYIKIKLLSNITYRYTKF